MNPPWVPLVGGHGGPPSNQPTAAGNPPARRLLSQDIRLSIISINAMVPVHHRLRMFPPLFGRLLAGGCAALVVLLAVLAASPALHQWLHHDAGAADHDCAVTLFQHGAGAAAAAIAVAATVWTVVALAIIAPLGPDLDRRRYWLPPGNAPPALN
jgi:hypothetical protein